MMCPYCHHFPMYKFTVLIPFKKVTYICEKCSYSENGDAEEEENGED